MRSVNQSFEGETQERVRRISNFRCAVVYIADLSGRIQYKNNILRMIQDALVKVMFSPQRRSRRFLVGDVENQPAILNQRSPGFANRSAVKKRFEKLSILLSHRPLMIPNTIPFRQLSPHPPTLPRSRNHA